MAEALWEPRNRKVSGFGIPLGVAGKLERDKLAHSNCNEAFGNFARLRGHVKPYNPMPLPTMIEILDFWGCRLEVWPGHVQNSP